MVEGALSTWTRLAWSKCFLALWPHTGPNTIDVLGERFRWLLESELLSAPVCSLGALIPYMPEVVKQEGGQLLSQHRAQCEPVHANATVQKHFSD